MSNQAQSPQTTTKRTATKVSVVVLLLAAVGALALAVVGMILSASRP